MGMHFRGVNFTPGEDKLRVSAWLNTSIDAIQGTDQKHYQLWGKIFEYFEQYKETTNERTVKSLTHRWSVIQKATNKFCATLAQVGRLNQSGMTEHDKFEKAKIMYKSLEKCNFQFEHCWNLLKDQPKWIGHATKEDPKRRKTVSPVPKTSPCSAGTEDNAIENDIIELDRPIGRKAEKGKRKALDKQIEESVQLRKLKYTLLEESRKKEEKKLHQEDERLKLEREKVKLAKKESDQRIMMMNLNGMTDIQKQYFQQLQKEIMEENDAPVLG
ncbi:hypothetical protein DCAR_0729001 [Daucus carota subsp. sativus]|uniref:No apical meristem-associated C-terminal domain-containing protein n=1 Tax=Daucus carota subsp. sativus TaxID=79200 RepID=A0AAF1B7J1_DAUCS|nr:hypothetical protein DCAR_0729001 [Daucus carota subsp. sativus]